MKTLLLLILISAPVSLCAMEPHEYEKEDRYAKRRDSLDRERKKYAAKLKSRKEKEKLKEFQNTVNARNDKDEYQ